MFDNFGSSVLKIIFKNHINWTQHSQHNYFKSLYLYMKLTINFKLHFNTQNSWYSATTFRIIIYLHWACVYSSSISHAEYDNGIWLNSQSNFIYAIYIIHKSVHHHGVPATHRYWYNIAPITFHVYVVFGQKTSIIIIIIITIIIIIIIINKGR